MTASTLISQITLLTDILTDLDNAIARLYVAPVVAELDPIATPEDTLYRTRLTQSLRTLHVVRAGLLGLTAVLMGEAKL